MIYRIALMALFLTGCSMAPRTDFSANVDYSQFDTYQFEDSTAPRSIDAKRIETALNSQLPEKGITLSHTDEAPLMVIYRIEDERELQSFGTTVGFGYHSRNMGIGMSTPERYREVKFGRLVLEFVDTQSNQVVWQAVSTRRLTESMSPQRREAFFEREIREMLALFPPY
ncbi:DUF4136 domain-containing protein [Thaumasiovibrio subtropicus]|uniref:DUF4136 domain-containing protein n=1 Tax=Thaumasiovibrio subtropicus TaxID=1891207 RepID=UPI000B355F97|nr:DUF4136 domain-containing protein [Thaumasiovibrio subtropicus]